MIGADRKTNVLRRHARNRGVVLAGVGALATASLAGTAAADAKLPNQTMQLGSTYTLTGHSAPRRTAQNQVQRTLVLRGSWNGGTWHVITRARTHGSTGLFRIVVKPTRRGVLRLRLRTPDTAYSVVLTVR